MNISTEKSNHMLQAMSSFHVKEVNAGASVFLAFRLRDKRES